MLQPLLRMSLIYIAFVLFLPFHAGAAELDIDYTVGVDALSQRDFKQAIKSLSTVVGADPNYKDARYLLGASYNGAGKYKKALTWLTQEVAANPSSGKTLLQLGIANLNLKQIEAAEDYFGRAQQAFASEPKNRALAYYYLGLAQQGGGKYQESLSSFEQAQKFDATLFAPTTYYSGVALQGLGKSSLAIAKLEEVRQKAPGTEYERRAAQLIKGIEGNYGDSAATFTFNASLGFQYDTNVILEPDTIEVSDEDDFRGIVVLGVVANLPWVTASYGFYQSQHLELDEFNVQNHRFMVEKKFASELRGKPITYGLRSVTNLALLSNDFQFFSVNSSLEPYVTRPINDFYSINVKFIAQFEDFRQEDEQRDNLNYGLNLSHLFNLMQGKGFLGFRSGMLYKDAGQPFDLFRFFSDVQLSFDVGLVTVGGQGAYSHDVYGRNTDSREDNRYDIGGSITKDLFEKYKVIASYQRTNASSNLVQFDYQRDVISLSFSGSF